jgi:hypothetical protein
MRNTLVVLASVFLLAACDSNSGSGGANRSIRVELSEVTRDECFNVQKYFQILRSMPATPVRYMTTDFEATALKNNFVPPNFLRRSAYQNFFLEDTAMSRVVELRPLAQRDCETVTFMAGPAPTEFKIVAKGPSFIAVENDFDEKLTYQWLSPTSMRVVHEYVNGDLNCHDKSKAMLKVTRELEWGNSAAVRAATVPQGRISERYIDLLTQATGYPKADLYRGDPAAMLIIPPPEATAEPAPDPEPAPVWPDEPPFEPGEGAKISVAKIHEMLQRPLRPELLRCN